MRNRLQVAGGQRQAKIGNFLRVAIAASALGSALGISTLACSSTKPDPYAEVSGFCDAYANAICQIGSTCQFVTSTCVTYQTQQCTNNAASAQAGGTRQYNKGNVPACISALNNAYGGSNTTSVSASTLASIDQTCNEVFVGSAAEMATCTSNYDCADPTQVCSGPPGQSPQCARPTMKDVGEACADPGDECPPGSTCTAETGTSVCKMTAPAAVMGEPCNTTADCATGLYCDTYTSTNAPTPTCVNEISFARASVDCLGIAGMGTMPSPVVTAEAGVADAGISPADGGKD